MPSNLTRLGEAPLTLAYEAEKLAVLIEREPASEQYDEVSWAGQDVTVTRGAGERIHTATVRVALAVDREAHPEFTGQLTDWQVLNDSDQAASIVERALRGRRIQIRTMRDDPLDDWVLFHGYIDKVELGWSGNNKESPRFASLQCTSVIVAADRELKQRLALLGQWRRTRQAELNLREDEQLAHNQCQLVTAEELVFNPDGRPNCHPIPIQIELPSNGDPEANDAKVWVFCDADFPGAEYWTVAKMLRYLQFAAVQTPIQVENQVVYDRQVFSVTTPLEEAQWTSNYLRFGNLTKLLRGTVGLQHDAAPTETPQFRALLRWLPDVALEAMSVLEAFTFVCEQAGILFDHEYEPANGLLTRTSLRFTIRGDAPQSRDRDRAPGATTRQVELFVRGDYSDTNNAVPAATIIAQDSARSGSVALDQAQTRGNAMTLMAATRYEATFELRPGWKPNAYLDVNQSDANVVEAAVDLIESDEFADAVERGRWYAEHASRHVERLGRYWVLNEDGAFKPSVYQRASGPWSTETAWAPYKFRSAAQITELAVRGDNGFTLRRRRFWPTRAHLLEDGTLLPPFSEMPTEVGILLEMSWDGGASWHAPLCKFDVDEERCAILIRTDDIGHARELRERGDELGMSLAEAYIRGRLRVRVTAQVEGDDAGRAFALWSGYCRIPQNIEWGQVLNFRGRFQRELRYVPGTSQATPISNTRLLNPTALYPLRDNGDDTDEAMVMAQRARDEYELTRCSGQAVIPWLQRELPNGGGYRIGDEVISVRTQVAGGDIPLGGVEQTAGPVQPGPRIVSIVYRYSDGEQSTTLTLDEPLALLSEPPRDDTVLVRNDVGDIVGRVAEAL